jgi:polyhydroxyalkanoate synthesis regulator phasin
MAKLNKSQARLMAEELLSLKPLADRYHELEKQLKEAMAELEMPEVEVKGVGRVFIAVSQRISVSPELARDVLGALANKIIEVKESVSNRLVDALVATGDISEDQHGQLVAGAKKTNVTSLYVRPLK